MCTLLIGCILQSFFCSKDFRQNKHQPIRNHDNSLCCHKCEKCSSVLKMQNSVPKSKKCSKVAQQYREMSTCMFPSHIVRSFLMSCGGKRFALSYVLQCGYYCRGHPDKVNQSQSRTETIGFNIFNFSQ